MGLLGWSWPPCGLFWLSSWPFLTPTLMWWSDCSVLITESVYHTLKVCFYQSFIRIKLLYEILYIIIILPNVINIMHPALYSETCFITPTYLKNYSVFYLTTEWPSLPLNGHCYQNLSNVIFCWIEHNFKL